MLPERIHLIGIGGAGMASLAQYLLATGRKVSGSDRLHKPILDKLSQQGAQIRLGHTETQIKDAELVVVSDAIPTGNIEFEAARRNGIPVLRRAECLDRLRDKRRAIMVAGSHGKSTTSAMIACILNEAGLDPGFVLGADVPALAGNRARPGSGDFLVVEACEAFRNLDFLSPQIAVITNIDDEHVNHYASQSALDKAFTAFAKRAQTVIISDDDAGITRLGLSGDKIIRAGLKTGYMVSAEPWPATFIPRIHGVEIGPIQLQQPGDHMRRNALIAIATCQTLGIQHEAIMRGLERFTGVARRWQDLGETSGIRIIDDYAHHPTEVAATLCAARTQASGRRLVAAFQPLLHSRVQRLKADFVESLALADQVILLDVDADGESGQSAGSAAIALALQERGVAVIQRENTEDLLTHISRDLCKGDMLLVMGGAGMAGVAEQVQHSLLETPEVPSPSSATTYLPSTSSKLWTQRIADFFHKPQTFVELFRSRMRKDPNAPALIGRDEILSYAALDHRSDKVAASLMSRGLHGAVIGVCLPLGTDLIVALLGVMKAQGTYLPLDPALPEARRAYMLEQAGASALIALNMKAQVPVLSPSALNFESNFEALDLRGSDGAYICFTSGSTGYPKGIRINNMALTALLNNTVKYFKTDRGARMLLNTSIGFDVSLAEICGTLAGGGALVVGGSRPLGGEHLTHALKQLDISHLSITPSLLASAPPSPLPQLRYIIACGEPCPPELVEEWAPGRHFFNVYGPTETTIYATAALCKAGSEITIGTTLDHVEAFVLNEDMRPVPTGEMGELCFAGSGVSEGYINRPDETAKHFVQATIDGRKVRLYRTGDMVRSDQNGILRFIGRADTQVKIHGMRIELGEIERIVLRQDGVVGAAVCFIKEPRPVLLCFVQAAEGSVLEPASLTMHLTQWLPEGAVPSRIQLVPSIPLTPSGKKDRQKLVADYGSRMVKRAPEYWPPADGTEHVLASLWQEALNLADPVGRLDRFPDLGGDSLASLILIQRIEEHFKISVPPGYFGRISALPQMATQIDELLWYQDGTAVDGHGFMASRIYRRMRDLCSQWSGTRLSPEHLITSLHSSKARHDIFLCCQMDSEFTALAKHLSPEFSVHGMRSGNLIIDNGPGDIYQLASHYAEELTEITPNGPILLAGVCQGGAIARTIAEILIAAGREVPLLVLIESGRPQPYAGRTALIWAEESFLNPLRPDGPGLDTYMAAMAQNISTDFVPGIHGHACIDPAVQFVAHHMTQRIKEAINDMSMAVL